MAKCAGKFSSLHDVEEVVPSLQKTTHRFLRMSVDLSQNLAALCTGKCPREMKASVHTKHHAQKLRADVFMIVP